VLRGVGDGEAEAHGDAFHAALALAEQFYDFDAVWAGERLGDLGQADENGALGIVA
jgi:hypothetical protein